MSTKTKAAVALTYPMTTIKKCLLLLLAARKPAFMWGGVGSGKTSLVHQIADELESSMYLINLSTMEPTDLGGHPYPTLLAGLNPRHILTWIQAENMLPWITPDRSDTNGIICFDEVDRCHTQTQNPAMNLMRERGLNGHKLCPSVGVICTGNGTSDGGTTPITKAMATRGVHLYVQTNSPQALDSWDGWAESKGLPAALRGFARYRQQLIVGPEPQFTELQQPTYRTAVDAWEMMELCATVPWGREVVEPLVFGSVGQFTGREMIAFQRMFDGAPSANEIAADPIGVPVPTDVGVLWALGRYLMDAAANGTQGEKVAWTSAFADYVCRWPDETAADWFRTSSTKLPSLVGTKGFKRWEKEFLKA